MISREYGRRDVGKLTGIAISATALGGINRRHRVRCSI